MTEEKTKGIQDRLRSVATRSKEIFASWPLIILILIILLFIVALPEILTHLLGRETLIPIFSKLDIESRFEILFGLSVVSFTAMQYKISKSLLKLEQKRSLPIVVAEVAEGSPVIFVENKGSGMAWSCEINLERTDLEGTYQEIIKEIYPWSGEQVNIPEEWHSDKFDLYIGIKYYTEENRRPDSLRKWGRIFKKMGNSSRF